MHKIYKHFRYFNKHEEIADYENTLSDYESDSELADSPSCLKDKINFNFADIKYNSSKNKAKFDFTEHYRLLYQSDTNNKIARVRWRNRKTVSQGDSESGPDKQELRNCSDEYQNVARTLSDSGLNASGRVIGTEENKSISGSVSDSKPSPIWCVDYLDDLVALGCADGHLEFWEGTTGKFKVMSSLFIKYVNCQIPFLLYCLGIVMLIFSIYMMMAATLV